jgi:putative ABC transport system substrate-binding protein
LKRREFITLLGGAAAWPLAARAQPPEPMRRVGVLMATADDAEGRLRIAAFREGLQKLGWVEGRNVQIDYRWASGDIERAKVYAGELVRLTPDVILAGSTPALRSLRDQTRTIPIVFAQVSDPIGEGFIESIARPGANITGFTNFEASMAGKWVEILKEIVPGLTHVAMLFNPRTAPGGGSYYFRSFEAVASAFVINPIASLVHVPTDIEEVITLLGKDSTTGLIVMPDTFTTVHRARIISSANRNRVPTIYTFRYFAADGGLISYGSDTADLFRRAAPYVNDILKGAKPAELPVQAPTKFELAINLKTAKALGLEIPPMLLARADEVIE